METVYRKMDLDTVFPIQSVTNGLIVSKRGDVTISWELELPVAFSMTEGGYDDILTAFHSAIRILPPWTMVHRQDWFLYDRFMPCYDGRFLHDAYESHFAGRRFLTHRQFLFLTMAAKAVILPTGLRIESCHPVTPGLFPVDFILSTQFNGGGSGFGFRPALFFGNRHCVGSTLFDSYGSRFAFASTFPLIGCYCIGSSLFNSHSTGMALSSTLFHANGSRLALCSSFSTGHVQSIFTPGSDCFCSSIRTTMRSGFRSGVRTAMRSSTRTTVTTCLVPVIVLNGVIIVLGGGIQSVPDIDLFGAPHAYQIFKYNGVGIEDFQFRSLSQKVLHQSWFVQC